MKQETEAPASMCVGSDVATFTCFPRLPIEIQCTIWRESIRGERFILMGFDFLGQCYPTHRSPRIQSTSGAMDIKGVEDQKAQRLRRSLLLGGFYFSPSVDVLILPDWQLLPTWCDLYHPSMRDAMELLLGGIGDDVVRRLRKLVVPMDNGMWENDCQDAITHCCDDLRALRR